MEPSSYFTGEPHHPQLLLLMRGMGERRVYIAIHSLHVKYCAQGLGSVRMRRSEKSSKGEGKSPAKDIATTARSTVATIKQSLGAIELERRVNDVEARCRIGRSQIESRMLSLQSTEGNACSVVCIPDSEALVSGEKSEEVSREVSFRGCV